MFEKSIKKFNEINKKIEAINNIVSNREIEEQHTTNINTATPVASMTKIDFDKIFENIESDTMAYLKNHKKLNEYVNLKNKKLKNNDILWAIYNEIKSEAEIQHDLWELNSVINHMGSLLYFEHKSQIEYSLCSFYLICYSLEPVKYINRLGTTRKREINTLLSREKVNLTADLFKSSIQKIAPTFYNESKATSIFNFLKENL